MKFYLRQVIVKIVFLSILDDGSCFVGDLEPIDYLDAYDNNVELKED